MRQKEAEREQMMDCLAAWLKIEKGNVINLASMDRKVCKGKIVNTMKLGPCSSSLTVFLIFL